jgi:hypothetical protein
MTRTVFFNTRQIPAEEVTELRVNREAEVDACVGHLNHRRANVFLWGARGVGKTFLVRLVDQELRNETSILSASIDVLGLPGFARANPATAFPEAVLLGICSAIWKEVLKRPYSELRARLDLREGDIRLPSKLARSLEKLYLQMMASQRKAHYEYSNSVGFSAGAKGEKKETGWVEQEQPPVLPFEFLEFCEELLEALKEHGKTRIVALCDEANLLPFEQQRDILGRYIDLFTSRSVQFLFVAGVQRWDAIPPPVPEGFDLILELRGLKGRAAAELLGKAARYQGVDIEADAVEIGQSQLDGNPRLLLLALAGAMPAPGASATITSQLMKASCRRLLAGEEELHRSMLEHASEARKARKRGA